MLQTESWVPICLPGISPDGFLQLFCSFFDSKIGIEVIFRYNMFNNYN